MNVLLVTGIFPPDSGGPSTHIYHLAESLISKENKVTIVTLSDRIDIEEHHNFKVYRIRRKIFYPFRILKTIFEIRRHLKKADVVYANGLYQEAFFANIFIKKPLIFKIVGDKIWDRLDIKGKTKRSFDEFQIIKIPLKFRFPYWLRKKVLQGANNIFVPSHYFVPIVQKWTGSKVPVQVIQNGCPPICFKSSSNISRHPGRFLIVARLIPRKKVDLVLRAINDLERPCQLQIIGSGPDEKRLRGILDHGISHHEVFWEGSLPREKVIERMYQAICLLVPSTHENFPHVILEAMHCGLPVIASDAGGIGEIIESGKNGLIVDRSEPSAWALAMKRILDSPDLQQKFRLEGMNRAKDFTWDKMVDQIIKLLESRA